MNIDILDIETGELKSLSSDVISELKSKNLISWSDQYQYYISLNKIYKGKKKSFYLHYINRYVKLNKNSVFSTIKKPNTNIGKIINLVSKISNDKIIHDLDFIFIVQWDDYTINLYRVSDLDLYN